MKTAMAKGGLLKKVADGQADAGQKKELLGLFRELAAATPPKGQAASWKTKTDALVTAGADLQKAANCKSCHMEHRGQ